VKEEARLKRPAGETAGEEAVLNPAEGVYCPGGKDHAKKQEQLTPYLGFTNRIAAGSNERYQRTINFHLAMPENSTAWE